MTTVIFEEYLRDLDRAMIKQKRKIALLLDNCSSHPRLTLENVKLVYLPPNSTSRTQPLDAGIINCLKCHYRKEMAKLRLVAFESNQEFMIYVLDALYLLKKAWEHVSGKYLADLKTYVTLSFYRDQTT